MMFIRKICTFNVDEIDHTVGHLRKYVQKMNDSSFFA